MRLRRAVVTFLFFLVLAIPASATDECQYYPDVEPRFYVQYWQRYCAAWGSGCYECVSYDQNGNYSSCVSDVRCGPDQRY